MVGAEHSGAVGVGLQVALKITDTSIRIEKVPVKFRQFFNFWGIGLQKIEFY